MPHLQPEIVAGGLTKRFGQRAVLNSIDLTVNRGEVVAIVGGSGSGKTVLLDCLTGLMEVTSGTVRVADHARPGSPLVNLSTLDEDGRDEVRLHWAVVFQRNALHSGTVESNVSLWLREHTDMPPDEIDLRVRRALAAAALDVEDVLTKDRDELSGGMAKRVAIARAIAIDPVVIFYDEPTTGLDPVVAGHIHELIWDVHQRPRPDGLARTTVIVTHDRDLLRRLRPRVVMLHSARVCFDGPYEAFTASDNPLALEYLSAMPVLQARNI